MLGIHTVVVVDGQLEHLARLGVGVLALPLVGVGIAFLLLAQRYLGFGDANVLAHQVALVYYCRVEDCGFLDGLGARLDVECSMSVYLSRRRCRRCVDSNGSALSRMKW